MTSKVKSKITIVTGIIALLMMFVVPLFLPNSIANNTTFVWIYFILFFSLVGWSNYTNEKIEKMSVEEKREEKLKEILK
jgi:FtsH-binding integral membrane protein